MGAGIVGASVAFRLSRGGAEVWLVDEDRPGAGTTSASFAWINANQKTPREYFELNRAGMEEHPRLGDELPGGTPWLNRSGNIIWAENREELERRVGRLRSWGYAAEMGRASEFSELLEPGLTLSEPETQIAFFPEEGWVDAPRLTNTLVDLAIREGAETRFGAAVESIDMVDGRVSGIRLGGGETIPADVVVNAAGPGADRVAALVGRDLPLAPKRGLLARVVVEGEPLRRIVHSPRVNLRPDGPGHVLLHHSTIDERLGSEPPSFLGRELLDRARSVLPALETSRIVGERIGVRPISADGFPCVGAVSCLAGYYEAVTHSGVTLGPLVGRLLAREILKGEIDPLLAPYSPARF